MYSFIVKIEDSNVAKDFKAVVPHLQSSFWPSTHPAELWSWRPPSPADSCLQSAGHGADATTVTWTLAPCTRKSRRLQQT